VPADLSRMAVMTTAWRRPYYFERILNSWARAEGSGQLAHFVIALGRTDRYDRQVKLIDRMRPKFGVPLEIADQSQQALASRGTHRAIAEAANHVFAYDDVDFLIFGEEDTMVSSDVLTYMAWAAEAFAEDRGVLAVLAHSRGGQGWDEPVPAQDADADQQAARILPYFNPWGWGTWRDRWEQIMEPSWDWECTSGGNPMQHGYDWNLQLRVMPAHNMGCVVPDASRSQNIGQHEGWATNPQTWAYSQAQSFRERREPCDYRLVG
jgi:hypothetical protein